MEIWLDTCDDAAIASVGRYGIIYGVTTNPSILAKAVLDHEKVISRLLDVQDGPIAVQVTAENAEGIMMQAAKLHAFSERIVIKVPVTQEGLIALKQLSQQHIATMATAVFHPHQALLAALAGADYLAPYIGRMYNSGIDAIEALKIMKTMYDKYAFKTKLIAAALQSPEQIVSCAEIGVAAVTLKKNLFQQFIADDSYTLETLESFSIDWAKSKHKSTSLLAF